jgi:hypothetical protein
VATRCHSVTSTTSSWGAALYVRNVQETGSRQLHKLKLGANDIVRAVAAGRHQEDDRVELKGEWTDAKKAAPKIAGAANTARGVDLNLLGGNPKTLLKRDRLSTEYQR